MWYCAFCDWYHEFDLISQHKPLFTKELIIFLKIVLSQLD